MAPCRAIDTSPRVLAVDLAPRSGAITSMAICPPEGSARPHGRGVQEQRADNESANMATAKGVLQGYCAVAAVDDRHQNHCRRQ